MKRTNLKKIVITVLCASFMIAIYSSCSNSSNDPSGTTVAEDKQNITNTINSFYTCLNTLDDGDFSNFLLYSLFNSGASSYNDSWIKTITDKFELQYGKMILNDKLQFATRTGVYTWNNTSQSFSKVANSSVITLIFPSKQGLAVNNAELSLNSYNDTAVTYNSVTQWLPTAANISLKRDGVLVFSLSLSNVSFNIAPNFSMPINADVTIYTAPFTHTFAWRRTTNTDFQLTYNSSTPQGCLTNLVTNLKLKDADYGNITSVKDDLKTVSGTLTEGNLKITYTINAEAISAITNPTPAQINANSDAEVFYNNAKIGDLTYDEINNKSEIFIVYSDGTSENVNVHVGNFETQVRNIFSAYLN